jgi:hypothetical protein
MMDYELLYKLIKENKGLKPKDVPNMLEKRLKGVKGDDLLTGILGMYIKKSLPESLSVSSDSISYSPNKDSSYGFGMGNNTPTISGTWRF